MAAHFPQAAVSIPQLDLARANQPLQDELLAAFRQVLESGRFLHGPEVAQLEADLARRCAVPHAIGCASGSDALLLALMAFGIGPGDEVIVPSFTFFATASAPWRLGAKVVFIDIEPRTFNLDAAKLEQAISPRTKAIIPVHLFGQCARLDTITEIAQRHGLRVIEDVAQAIGAAYLQRPAGSWGDVGCFSFYPTKNLGGLGDGGLMTAVRDEIADRLRLLASHGMRPRYYHSEIGINSRLDSLQAAALLVKLKHLTDWTQQRQEIAARYEALFHSAQLTDAITLPTASPQGTHVWNQYTIRVPSHGQNGERRNRLRAELAEQGVHTEVYYPLPLHLQECFRDLGHAPGSFPESERAANEVLSLPIYPGLTVAEQVRVVDALARTLARPASHAA